MYFENLIDNTRLTIDVDLNYFSPITNISFKEKYIIVEIKYNRDINFINNFNNIFLSDTQNMSKAHLKLLFLILFIVIQILKKIMIKFYL